MERLYLKRSKPITGKITTTHSFYYNYTFRCNDYTVYGQCISPLNVSIPCSLTPLRELIALSKQSLKNNFLPCVIGIASSILPFHYQSIMEIQDECPLILLYSSHYGAGMCICWILFYMEPYYVTYLWKVHLIVHTPPLLAIILLLAMYLSLKHI